MIFDMFQKFLPRHQRSLTTINKINSQKNMPKISPPLFVTGTAIFSNNTATRDDKNNLQYVCEQCKVYNRFQGFVLDPYKNDAKYEHHDVIVAKLAESLEKVDKYIKTNNIHLSEYDKSVMDEARQKSLEKNITTNVTFK
jgi:hypothetical protein